MRQRVRIDLSEIVFLEELIQHLVVDSYLGSQLVELRVDVVQLIDRADGVAQFAQQGVLVKQEITGFLGHQLVVGVVEHVQVVQLLK